MSEEPFSFFPNELVQVILQLLDLESVLAMAVVSKHLSSTISQSFGDEFWSDLSQDLLGFKSLALSKHQLIKMLPVRDNVLAGRFSCSRISEPMSSTYPPRYSQVTISNNRLFFGRKMGALPPPTSLIENDVPPGFTRISYTGHMTNIAQVYSKDTELILYTADGNTKVCRFSFYS